MKAGVSSPMRSATPQENEAGTADCLAQDDVIFQFAATAKETQPETERRGAGEGTIGMMLENEILDV